MSSKIPSNFMKNEAMIAADVTGAVGMCTQGENEQCGMMIGSALKLLLVAPTKPSLNDSLLGLLRNQRSQQDVIDFASGLAAGMAVRLADECVQTVPDLEADVEQAMDDCSKGKGDTC